MNSLQDSIQNLVRILKEKRIEMNLTQTQIADMMKTSQSAIARLESGNQNSSLLTLLKYANIVNVKIKIIMDDE